jgi:hypothetical protein
LLSRSEIRSHARAFWEQAGGRERYGRPIDIEIASLVALPLVVERISGLTVAGVQRFIGRLREFDAIDARDAHRPLHGFLFADLDVAALFVDADDSPDEQRVTIAHEAAHFLLHYLEPRRRAATAFGPAIVSVLDRSRDPTRGERFSAALRAVPLEPWRHALWREPSGHVHTIEAEADDLAMELLAPVAELRALGPVSPADIAREFGLPGPFANRLFQLLRQGQEPTGVVHLFKK